MKSLPLVSFHGGHSGDLCAHADDTKSSLIETYLSKGFTQFAITEHVPPPDDSLLYFDEIGQGLSAKDLTDRFDRYFFETVPQLKKMYGTQADILFGFETEFHGNDPLARVSELIDRYKPELIVASVHHVNNHPYDITKEQFSNTVSLVGGIDSFYQLYFDHQFDLLQHLVKTAANIPCVVGHIDLPKIFAGKLEKRSSYWPLLERNIIFAKQNCIPLEVNTHCFKKGFSEPYPSAEILECIAIHGAMITLGDDSHRVSEVGHYWKETAALIEKSFNSVAKLNPTSRKWELVSL